MTSFFEISEFLKSLFVLWTFILCVAGIKGIIFAFSSNRHRYAGVYLASLGLSYFLWQVIFDISRFGKTEPAAGISLILGELPTISWVFVLLLITFVLYWNIYLNKRYAGMYITPLAMKVCADRMSCGICYWRDSGRVIFSNICMNRLCVGLTDSPLNDGNVFREAVQAGILPVGDKVWKFTCRDLVFEGAVLHEMVAWDISEIHAKTEALRKENEELARLNSELKAYSFKIDDVVRRQEILQAKVNIHDEMNRLMLSSASADSNDRESLDRVFGQWRQNALLLCMETEKKKEKNAESRLEQLAGALDIRLIWHNNLIEDLTEKQRELFFAAAQEAVTNAVKHAEAKTMEISFEKNETGISVCFENNGKMSPGEVMFTGGLSNLDLMARDRNCKIKAIAGKSFSLLIYFPKK